MTAQQQLDGMPRRLVTVTASRVDAWLSCPRRYRFTYVDRPRPPRGRTFAHQTLGAAVHEALLHYYGDHEPADRGPGLATELVQRAWPDAAASAAAGFRDAAQSRRWQEVAAGWVADYAAAAPAELRPRAVERVVSFTTSQARYEGRLDRLDLRGETAVVVDYKTGRRPPTEEDARVSSALALYAVGVERVLRLTVSRVELHHLPTATIVGVDLDLGVRQRHLDRMAAAAAEAEDAAARLSAAAGGEAPDPAVADELFPARPGPLCGWCDYRAACRDGQAIAAVQPWAGLPEDQV
jgi:RecB family exonuclease